MNCKRCNTLLTEAHEATLCAECGQAVLRGAPIKLQENQTNDVFGDVFGNIFGGKT